MRERIWHNVALAPPLQAIISDSRCCLKCRLDIAGLDDAPLFLRMVRPHAGKAVSLELDPHLELICLELVHATLSRLHPWQDSEQVLHVMTYLMRDDVRLGKLAALASDLTSSETLLEILKKCGVEIHLPIIRAVKWTHGGLRKSARRARAAGKHNKRGRLVHFSGLGKNLFPLGFRASENGGYELAYLIGRRFRTARGGL
jgi:hypothetical protein